MDGLENLTEDECWDLLRSQRVGRIGFDRGRGPRIHPVSYAVRGGDLVITTSEGSELGSFVRMFADGSHVSFEVDRVDGSWSERWSVLVLARISLDDSGGGVDPHVPTGHDELVVRLTPLEVTGRRISPSGVS